MSLLAEVGVMKQPADGSNPISTNHNTMTFDEMEEYAGDGVEVELSEDELACDVNCDDDDHAASAIAKVFHLDLGALGHQRKIGPPKLTVIYSNLLNVARQV